MKSETVRPYRDFGSWLRSRRLARRWTQEELAQRLAYDVTYIRKIEWGERPSSEALRVRVAQVLDIPVSSLPPAVPVAAPHRLPDATGALIGRDVAVEAVIGLFTAGERLVTVLGAPGIGKTRLALAVAARLNGRLDCDARFVPLLEVADGESITRPIAEALGISGPAGDRAGLERLVDALSSQEIVLVMDNFEHVLPEARLIGQLLARVPTLRALVTSRQALELRSEVLYVLPPLELPECLDDAPEQLARVASVALFVASARKVQPEFAVTAANAEAVAAICVRLQGIPLAIELAAGSTRVLTPHALLGELGDGLRLPAAGPRDAPDHHRTLGAAIDWSFARLDGQEQKMLSRLAVFAGGCTIEAAAAVCCQPGEEPVDPRAAVLGLAGKSLLEPVADGAGRSRYVALQAVRAFAMERLVSMGDADRIRRRHAAWALEMAETKDSALTGSGQADALVELDIEHANLRAALEWSLEHDPPVAIRLCGVLWRFWWTRGHLAEGRRWLDLALLAPQHDAGDHARALTGAGVLARAQGGYTEAVASLERACALWHSVGDQGGLALALLNLGIVAVNQAEYERASLLFEESRGLYLAIGDGRGVGHTLNCLGTIRLGQGDLDASSRLFEEALAIFTTLEDDWSSAMVYANLGWTAHKRGRGSVARLLYEKGLAMYRSLGDDAHVAQMLLNLGIASESPDDGVGVTGLLKEALLIFSRLGERRCMAECLDALALSRVSSDPGATAVLLAASDSLIREIGAARWPDHQGIYDRALDAVRLQLPESDFDVAWQQGRMMSMRDVIELGLSTRLIGPLSNR